MTNSDLETTATPRVKAADIERIRFSRELTFADQLASKAFPPDREATPSERPSADRVRRRLLTTHIKLSANMAPEVFDYARQAATALGLTKPVEIYQAAGEENAANWLCSEVVFISGRAR